MGYDRRTDRSEGPYELDAKAGKMSWIEESDEDGAEPVVHDIPWRYQVCGTCEGRGTHVNPSVDSQGISEEEFAEDPDFRENYMSGMYDVTCGECGGQRVVAEPDWDALKGKPELLEKLEDAMNEAASSARESRIEREMGY